MNTGEVYELTTKIHSRINGDILLPGDIVEVISINFQIGAIQFGLYANMNIYEFSLSDVSSSFFRLISTTRLLPTHPARQVSPRYPGLGQIIPAAPQNMFPPTAPMGAPIPGNVVRPLINISPLMPLLPYGVDPACEKEDDHSGNSASPLLKCECGCASIGVSYHSDYCPLYEKRTT